MVQVSCLQELTLTDGAPGRTAFSARLWRRKVSTSKVPAPLCATPEGSRGPLPPLAPSPPHREAAADHDRHRLPVPPASPSPPFPSEKRRPQLPAAANSPLRVPCPARAAAAPRPPRAASPAARGANGSNHPLGPTRLDPAPPPLPPPHDLPAHLRLAGGHRPLRGRGGGGAGQHRLPHAPGGGGERADGPSPAVLGERRRLRMLTAGRREGHCGGCSLRGAGAAKFPQGGLRGLPVRSRPPLLPPQPCSGLSGFPLTAFSTGLASPSSQWP